MTFTQLLQRSLRHLNYVRPGQSPGPDVKNECLLIGNDMLDAWLLDELLVFARRADPYTLTPGIQSYTIGPTGDFVTARPTKIEEANIILNTTTPVVRKPIEVINPPNVSAWALIAVQSIPNAIPLILWYDGNWSQTAGNATIRIWPGPLAAYQLELFTWQQLQSFADLTTNYTFPPGYTEAMSWGLAEKLGPMYQYFAQVKQADMKTISAQALKAKAAIQNYNAPEVLNQCDVAYLGRRRGGAFNFLTGGNGREL